MPLSCHVQAKVMQMPLEQQTVHLIEENDCLRISLSSQLQKHQYAVYEYRSGLEFLQNIPPVSHACVLLNSDLPKMNGLELQSVLAKRHYPLPLIFLSSQHDIAAAVTAMKNGAYDFLEVPILSETLVTSIRNAIEDNRSLIRKTMAIESLTAREQEVVKLVLKGKLNKETAYLLQISEKTVEFHRKNIREKLSSFNDVITI